MKTLILTLYLQTGQVIAEPTTLADCRELLAFAALAADQGVMMSRDMEPVRAVSCDGDTVLLGLISLGPCEMEDEA